MQECLCYVCFVFAEFLVFVFCSNISCREKQKRCRDARMFVFCVFFAGVFLCLCFVLILVAGRCNAIEMQKCKNVCVLCLCFGGIFCVCILF